MHGESSLIQFFKKRCKTIRIDQLGMWAAVLFVRTRLPIVLDLHYHPHCEAAARHHPAAVREVEAVVRLAEVEAVEVEAVGNSTNHS